MKRLVFATNNLHKLEEARAILGDDVCLVSLAELGCHEDIPETSDTLKGNALLKARYVHEHYGVDCVADDTGLMVDALNGAPGVYSARYATPGHDSAANMAKLLREMEHKENREAHFSTVIAYVDSERELTFEGRVDGRIAREPEGDSGFGYDPVFIAAETGRTFASMDADEKNAISHRGRALRKFCNWYASLLTVLALLLGFSTARASQWRQHASYNGETERIIDIPNYTYFLTLKQEYDPADPQVASKYGAIYRYDKRNDEWEYLNKSTGLSENIVVAADYDYASGKLVIGYDNGNIDLLADNGTKVNVPGLKMAGANASTKIVGISSDASDGSVWIATSTGYVRIDPRRGEVITSRNYGRSITSVARFDGHVWVGGDGLLYGDERSSDTGTFTTFSDVSVERMFVTDASSVWVVTDEDGKHILNRLTRNGDGYLLTRVSDGGEYSVEPGRGGVLTNGDAGVRWISNTGAVTGLGKLPATHSGARAGSVDGRTVWMSDGRKGFSRLQASGGRWTVTLDSHFPNASNAFLCTGMAYSNKYGMMVRNHGPEQVFENHNTADLISGLKDGTWKPLSTLYSGKDTRRAFTVYNPWGLAIDPANPEHVYCGSISNGLFRLNLAEPENSLRLTRSNDGTINNKGCVAVVDPPATWNMSCAFAAPRFDNSGTLWTAYYNPDNEDACLWYWTKENRLASHDRSDYRPMGKLPLRGVQSTSWARVLPLTGSRNRLVFHMGRDRGFAVLDHGGTPDNTSDDRLSVVNTLVDQDGNNFSIGLVQSLTEDPLTGRVWVTGETGLYTFSPSDILNGQTTVRRVKVPRNDGTNLADYLLDGVYVTCIATEPAGRKWFGTLGAGIVVTSSDGRSIVFSYTAEDSELPDDNIHGMCYNPGNNSMMISTGKGLCELYLPEVDSDGEPKVRAYPNPVRPEYMGNVTIDGLPDGATAKITGIAGELIKDLGTAAGGRVTWNITDNNNTRVPSGIYYVHATNGEDSDSYSRVTRLLVVN